MSKNTGTSELINYFDLGANGDVGIAGSLDVNTIANATTDTDKFLVSDTGIIKYRTGAELLSDIGAAPAVAGGYVPYTGATTNVDLGIYNITAHTIRATGSANNAGQINLRSDAIFSLVNGYGTIGSGTTNQFNFYQTTGAGVFRGAIFSLNSITASATRTYTLPDADGTIALTSAIPANPVGGTGTAGQVAYWSSGSAITGSSNFLFDASQRNLTIDRSLTTLGNALTISKLGDSDQAWLAFRQGGGASGTWRLGYTGDPYDFRINVGSDSSIGAQALRIFLATQNVLIGTGTGDAGFKLDVNGTGRFSGNLTCTSATFSGTITSLKTSGEVFAATSATTGSLYQRFQNSGSQFFFGIDNSTGSDFGGGNYSANIYSGSNVNLNFATNNAIRLTITGGGNVGIGTTTINSERLTVAHTTGNASALLVYTTGVTTGQSYGATIIGGTNSSDASFRVFNQGAGSNYFTIRGDGNVGIGTTSPDNKLAVWGTNNGLDSSQGNINVYTTDTAAINTGGSIGLGGYYTGTSQFIPFGNITGKKENSSSGDAAGYLAFLTRNSSTGTGERMRITSDGNVLVGATNPDVGGSVKGACIRQNGSIVAATNISSPFHYQSPITADRMNTQGDGLMYGMWRQGIFQAGIGATNGSVMTFFTGNNSSMTEQMRITSGGNVLIGTTTDVGFKLNVNGTLKWGDSTTYAYSGADSGGIYIETVGTTTPTRRLRIQGVNNAGTSYSSMLLEAGISEIAFLTTDIERMRIKSNGNVLIGTTTDTGARLNVGGSYQAYPVSIEAMAGGGQLALTRSGAVAEFYMGGSTGGGTQLYVRSGGSGGVRLDAGSTGWVSASDIRLKDIKKPIENAVESLSTLQTVYYSWKDSDNKNLHIGLIAQEVEKVFPELVSESSIDGMKGVNYTELIPVIIKAIQELNKKINA